MTNEELQGKIEFIINHQARFSSDLDRVKDLITQLAVAGRDRFADHDRKIAALVDSQIKSEERMAQSEKRMAEVDETLKRIAHAQEHGDERLNALIEIVDRWIREKRNGGGSAS